MYGLGVENIFELLADENDIESQKKVDRLKEQRTNKKESAPKSTISAKPADSANVNSAVAQGKGKGGADGRKTNRPPKEQHSETT